MFIWINQMRSLLFFICITWYIADETAKQLPLLRARFQTTAKIAVINDRKE